MYINVIVIQTT